MEAWAQKCHRRRGNRWPPIPTDNVFLRSIVATAGESVGPAAAAKYIGQFVQPGDTDDVSKIERIVVQDLGFSNSPSVPLEPRLENTLYAEIAALRLKERYDSVQEKQNAESPGSVTSYL